MLPATSFEEGLSPWQRKYGQISVDEAVGHTGRASLRIDEAGAAVTELLPLDGACWRLTFWMRTQDVVRGGEPWHRACVQVSYYDTQKKSLGHFDLGQTLGTTDWTRYERELFFDPKEGVCFVQIALSNWNCTGTTWFDDVELVTAPLPEAYRKVPPLPEVENRPPRTWRSPPVLRDAALQPAVQAVGASRPVSLDSAGFDPPRPEAGTVAVQGLDIDRGYMTRRVDRRGPGAGPGSLHFEAYEETFRGSPIHSRFERLWLPAGQQTGRLAYRLVVKGDLSKVRYFAGNQLTSASPDEPLTLGADTTKPFVILSTPTDDAGVVFFHPIPPEIRRWHVEDYLVEQELPARVSFARQAGGCVLTYDFGAPSTQSGGFCHSFDFYTFAMPYTGPVEAALTEFQLGQVSLLEDRLPFSESEPRGYWQPFMGLSPGARLSRMARYFPREFSSWMDSSGWDYGHKGGHGWGCTTATMKGIRVDANATGALARDYATRMLTFFLEASGDTGAPPNMYTWRSAAASLDDLEEHFTTVFCQYWEWRLGEFRAWLRDSKLLTPAERGQIYNDLQRARKVYDPAFADTTWTYPTPNGGYWFEYHDKPRNKRRWVINTHATSLGNVGDLAFLARELGKDEDYDYWRRVFERGVDGLIWVWEQPDMWADWDPNEVLYARPPDGGPRGYHRYMVTAWTAKVVDLALEMGGYRLADLLKYWKRMANAQYTTDGDRQMIQPLLQRAEGALNG